MKSNWILAECFTLIAMRWACCFSCMKVPTEQKKPVSLLNVSGIALKAFDVINLSRLFNFRHTEVSNIEEKFR